MFAYTTGRNHSIGCQGGDLSLFLNNFLGNKQQQNPGYINKNIHIKR